MTRREVSQPADCSARNSLSFLARSPPPLFLAIAAVLHAAPLSSVRLAGVDEIDLTVRRATLANTAVVGGDEQVLNGQSTGM